MKDTTIAVGLAKNVFEIAISREAGKVPKESPRSGKPRAKLWCPRGRSCSRVDTALRGEVGAGRRRVPNRRNVLAQK